MKISCVCPTRQERRGFLESMVNCFLSQTFPDKELVILDEAVEPWRSSLLELPFITYKHLGGYAARFNVGTKRNMVNELTTGDVIAHFDDDDWSHPERLAQQAATLVLTGKRMVGYHDLLYYRVSDRSLWKYVYQGKPQPYATGTSQMYYREDWKAHPFNKKVVGEDSDFSFDFERRKELFSEEGRKMVVAFAHSSNTYNPQFGSVPFLKADRSEFPEEFLRTVNL